ncbi:hypothetical protein J6590_038522 [Homalodisca vitripennis]|nr:hypothetical protein J6590_038522 [Homalodisca vitripennis]
MNGHPAVCRAGIPRVQRIYKSPARAQRGKLVPTTSVQPRCARSSPAVVKRALRGRDWADKERPVLTYCREVFHLAAEKFGGNLPSVEVKEKSPQIKQSLTSVDRQSSLPQTFGNFESTLSRILTNSQASDAIVAITAVYPTVPPHPPPKVTEYTTTHSSDTVRVREPVSITSSPPSPRSETILPGIFSSGQQKVATVTPYDTTSVQQRNPSKNGHKNSSVFTVLLAGVIFKERDRGAGRDSDLELKGLTLGDLVDESP